VIESSRRAAKQRHSDRQPSVRVLQASTPKCPRPAYGRPCQQPTFLLSGIARQMAANGSGLQRATVRNVVLARVLTFPAAMPISDSFGYSRLYSHSRWPNSTQPGNPSRSRVHTSPACPRLQSANARGIAEPGITPALLRTLTPPAPFKPDEGNDGAQSYYG